VVKNVTGYDLCKLLAGSWGTLAALHEVSLKVLPAPERIRTVLITGLDEDRAIAALGEAMSSAHDVSGAAHLPAAQAARSAISYVAKAGAAVTALRVEGIGPSVETRCRELRALFAGHGDGEELHSMNSRQFWREIRDVAPFAGDSRAVWRISLPPAAGALLVAALRELLVAEAYYDWGGGLVWLAPAAGEDAGAALIHAAAAAHGGHATLLRASGDVRAAIAVFKPQAPAVAALTARLKESFDPTGVLNPGRMYPGV
jgi:glycolate oxidase FAD binding subunit